MRRRAFLSAVWAGLLAGCSGRDESETTESTTYGYGGSRTTPSTSSVTTTVLAKSTTGRTSVTDTSGPESDEYGQQGYGTLGYGG